MGLRSAARLVVLKQKGGDQCRTAESAGLITRFNPLIGCSKVHEGCTNCYAEADQDKRRGRVKWGPNGTRSVTSESYWKQPLRWNREVEKQFDDETRVWASANDVTREHLLSVGSNRAIDALLDQGFIRENHGRYKRIGKRPGTFQRPRVFCASLADVFEDWPLVEWAIEAEVEDLIRNAAPGQLVDHLGRPMFHESMGYSHDPKGIPSSSWSPLTMADVRRRLFGMIDATPNLCWLLLTKRPENIRRMWHDKRMPRRVKEAPLSRRSNVWLGCSVSNQETADRMVPKLLTCRDLAPVLFVSCEPLLGRIDLSGSLAKNCIHSAHNHQMVTGHKVINSHHIPTNTYASHCTVCDAEFMDTSATLDWCIWGGESGPNARRCDLQWIRDGVRQCREAGVPAFVKQLGSNAGRRLSKGKDPLSWSPYRTKDGKGADPEEWPDDLRVQQFPQLAHNQTGVSNEARLNT